MNNRNDFVAAARNYIGASESNGGADNIKGIYNGHRPLARNYKVKKSDPWCAVFASFCAIITDCARVMPIECSAPEMVKQAQAAGMWVENDNFIPQPGDLILYDWDDNGIGDDTGTPDHIGIIERVDDGVMTVIEGNYHDAVGRRVIHCGSRFIRGFITPRFYNDSIDTVARDCIAGKYGNGIVRRRRLQAAGYDYTEVQEAINRLIKK